jgi:hypothetical protein
MNGFACLSAIVLDPETRRLSYRCSAYFHAENVEWLKLLFAMAVTHQVADAHARIGSLARTMGGQVTVSAHPRSGPRAAPDDMLNIIENFYVPAGRAPCRVTEADFQQLLNSPLSRMWVLATGGRTGLTAEIPFYGDTPALNAARGGRSAPGTALLQVSTDQPHPQLGNGVLIRLTLPVANEHGLANALNLAEPREFAGCHFLGSWCSAPPSQGGGPTFVTFLPSMAATPDVLGALIMSSGLRAKWAREFLDRRDAGSVERSKANISTRQGARAAGFGSARALRRAWWQWPWSRRERADRGNQSNQASEKPLSHFQSLALGTCIAMSSGAQFNDPGSLMWELAAVRYATVAGLMIGRTFDDLIIRMRQEEGRRTEARWAEAAMAFRTLAENREVGSVMFPRSRPEYHTFKSSGNADSWYDYCASVVEMQHISRALPGSPFAGTALETFGATVQFGLRMALVARHTAPEFEAELWSSGPDTSPNSQDEISVRIVIGLMSYLHDTSHGQSSSLPPDFVQRLTAMIEQAPSGFGEQGW